VGRDTPSGHFTISPLQLVTLLKLLGFLKLHELFSHFDGVFTVFMGQSHLFDIIFEYFAPLLPSGNSAPTFF
jgi:hypothetical protein